MLLFIEKMYYFIGTILLNNQSNLDLFKNDMSTFLGVNNDSHLSMFLCVVLFFIIIYLLFRLIQIIIGLLSKFIGGVWNAWVF